MLLAPRSWLHARRSPLLAFLVFAGCGSVSSMVYGQADGILDKTTFGRSQNSPEDLANSLVPGPKRYGRGEKKEEVDLKNLQSKSSKDTTFQGTLMDLDVDWHGNKLGKPKTNDEKDSKAAKSADAGGAKDSKVSKQADTSAESGAQDANFTAGGREPLANRPREAGDSVSGKPKDPKASKSTEAGDGKNKDQKAASAASTETTSEKEKASATKPDGDH